MGDKFTPGSDLPSGLVTFLFTDIEGSTRLAHTLGDGYRRVLHDHRLLLRQVFDRHTGAELLTEGDSFFVAFSDASSAVDAALEAQYALAAHDWPTDPQWSGPARPKVRMGLHTGTATPDDQGYATATVHRAARVCAAAHGDQILCTQSTLDSIGGSRAFDHTDLGLHLLRGFDDSERLHQVAGFGLPRRFPAPLAQRRHDNLPADSDAFIGRGPELAQLTRLVTGHRLTSVTALPRTGKTRLIRQLAHRLAPSYHDGAWYAGLGDTLDPAQVLAEALGLRGDPFRGWLDTAIEALRTKNCLLIFDDTRTQDSTMITRILTECPQVTILSASQRPLGLTGEVKWALPTMSVQDAAVLLRRRATEAAGGIDPGDCTELASVVDGFPPTIGILARGISVFGRAELLRRMRSNPMAILDARGQLTEVLEAACAPLTPRASQLLRAMSALPGPAGVDEAERLCGGSAAALDALIDLVDTSLVDVQRSPTGAAYRLPAPVRWYVDAKRRALGEATPVRAPRPSRFPLPRLSWTKAKAMT